jgi:hypothetical protein
MNNLQAMINFLFFESGINFGVLMEPCSINLNLIFSNENHSEINNFFFLLVSKLRNDKHAHCLVKSFLALINVEQGAHDLQGLPHDHIQKKKTNTYLKWKLIFAPITSNLKDQKKKK